MIIGIDFSINSTGVAIKTKDDLILMSFSANYKSHLKGFRTHEKIKDLVQIFSYIKEGNTKDPLETQQIKIRNANRLSDIIMEKLEPYLDKCTQINIEGFSYSSSGNSFIDIVMYNSFLRCKLYERVGDSIFIVPPKTLKKRYSGNGNANKCFMLTHYVDNTKSELRDLINSLDIIEGKKFFIPKPIDDLVDAIALTEVEFSLQIKE